MQAITIACSVLFVVVDFAQAQNQDDYSSLYTKRYERLDIDTILASPRLVTNYVECLLNKKPCAPEGKSLKKILPEALRTKCGRCHPSQKEVALKVITALYYDYPQYYKALQEKWDPSNEYNKRFEEYLRDQKFNAIGGSDSEPGEQAQGSSISINITQRPTRQGEVAQSQGQGQTQVQGQKGQESQTQNAKPSISPPANEDTNLPEILNRFGSDDGDGYEYESPKSTTTSTQAPSVAVPKPQQPQKPQQHQKPAQPQKPQQPAPSPTIAPSRRPSNNGNNSPSSGSSSKPAHIPSGSHSGAAAPSHNTWNHHQPAPGFSTTTTYYLNTQNPVLNIINRITMKFANTAEFIAGMLRGAVPQPQAPIHKDDILRKFCDRLRKTFMSYTNNNQNKKNHHQRYY